jgi:hypothetical protein
MLAVLVALSGCRQAPKQQAPNADVAWHRLGSWSGRGNTQTESFLYESGALRVRWETTNEQSGRSGKFRLILASAVSGRQMAVPVEQRGIGKGESFIGEIPHQAYIIIESSDLDWSFTIDEGTIGTKRDAS